MPFFTRVRMTLTFDQLAALDGGGVDLREELARGAHLPNGCLLTLCDRADAEFQAELGESACALWLVARAAGDGRYAVELHCQLRTVAVVRDGLDGDRFGDELAGFVARQVAARPDELVCARAGVPELAHA